ncbi:MAG: hypothetical protein K2P80_08015 [Beijerinckiaceae bacterium]|nr:hypothetical protein [Beijerinckiaceae bacterium]
MIDATKLPTTMPPGLRILNGASALSNAATDLAARWQSSENLSDRHLKTGFHAGRVLKLNRLLGCGKL